MLRPPRLFALLALGALLTACGFTPNPLGAALDADPELSEFRTALEDAGLLATLEGLDEVTIFAPVNDAFPSLTTAQPTLADTLAYHAVPGMILRSSDLVDGQVLGTQFAKSALAVEIGAGTSLADGTRSVAVIATDFEIANGVVHKIGAVLTPPPTIAEVADDAGFSMLLEALTAVGLDTLFDGNDDGPYTVFAPSDDAFEALLADRNVADLAGLVALLGADAVADILRYHVVDGLVGEAAAVAAATPLTAAPVPTLLAGATLDLGLDGGAVVIANPDGLGDAAVTATNEVASNGVVHAIDQVLLPPAAE